MSFIQKIGFTGTRHEVLPGQLQVLESVLSKYVSSNNQFHHGDCIGADELAHDVALRLGFYIVIHPPIVGTYRAFKNGNECRPELPYLVRNKNIVNETNRLIAISYTFEEVLRSGTWSTVRYAIKKKRPVSVIYPDGSFEER